MDLTKPIDNDTHIQKCPLCNAHAHASCFRLFRSDCTFWYLTIQPLVVLNCCFYKRRDHAMNAPGIWYNAGSLYVYPLELRRLKNNRSNGNVVCTICIGSSYMNFYRQNGPGSISCDCFFQPTLVSSPLRHHRRCGRYYDM
jgi:hypothetical protein